MCQEKLTWDTLIKTRDGHQCMNTSFNDGRPVFNSHSWDMLPSVWNKNSKPVLFYVLEYLVQYANTLRTEDKAYLFLKAHLHYRKVLARLG